jgi:hypothetical protein
MSGTQIELSRPDRVEDVNGQTLITVRRAPKARLKLLLQHTPAARPMIDIVSEALDAITIPELQKRGLITGATDLNGR